MAQAERLVLKDVPMLLDVNITGWSRSYNFVRDVAVSWLSSCLSKLEVLTLFDLSSPSDQPHEQILELPQLSSLKQLTLLVYASKDRGLIGCTSLIKASPNLEKFVLKLQLYSDIKRSNREFKKAKNYPHQHLKVVKISGYYGRKSEVELINYFLEIAIALENIIVDPHEELTYRSRSMHEEN
ncbi:uncharacterized protein [Coffea arabica]|uniref:At1g61320/AtMIF1 LRR domain-containing protein n=1 Tax=Coffea arabica TaxID=13443 RepID=A0A6P6UJ69_COFAR|nr:uncharacterized protein LOC113711566 [Coffea arabica]